MKVEFLVHNVSRQKTSIVVSHGGEDLSVEVSQLEVELVTTDAMHGSLTLRFIGKAADEAATKFVKDQLVEGEF